MKQLIDRRDEKSNNERDEDGDRREHDGEEIDAYHVDRRGGHRSRHDKHRLHADDAHDDGHDGEDGDHQDETELRPLDIGLTEAHMDRDHTTQKEHHPPRPSLEILYGEHLPEEARESFADQGKIVAHIISAAAEELHRHR